MSRLIDLTGQRFGRLTVQKYDKCAYWLCACDCGNTVRVDGSHLRKGVTQSCGCLQKDLTHQRFAKHNMRSSRLYSCWTNMKNRCLNSNSTEFHNYGGRGIEVCQEWLDSFETFRDWALANGYADNLTIDRIDVNGNYEPSNCRWATAKEQANNTTKNHYITHNGISKSMMLWAEEFHIPYNKMRYLVYSGLSIDEILRTCGGIQ